MLYNTVLVSAVQQESALKYTYIPLPLEPPSHHRALSYSLNFPAFSPRCSPQVHSLCLCLYSRPENRFNGTIFFYSLYICVCVCVLLLLFFVVQLLSCVQLFATPWTAAGQASWSFTISRSLLKLMSTESMMPSNHLTPCRPLLLLLLLFPSIRVFSNESALRIRWPKYWSFSFSPSNEHSGLISFRIGWCVC